MGKYFGTDGFRGEANVVLTVEHAYRVGRFLGYYYGRDHKARVVIGKDTRRSSYMFEYSLVAGLTASGADVDLLHVTTTPSVSYVVRTDGYDCGIMISASHNPYYDNGIKILNAAGGKLEAEVEALIEQYIDGTYPEEVPLAHRDNIGKTQDYSAGRNRYTGYLISLAAHSYKNMRVGLDCANGSSFMIAKAVFEALGAKTYVINNEPNGLNINLDCGSTHIEALQQLVKDEHLDVGFAYDGDADRCIAVDDHGNVVDGDRILYVCGVNLKKRGQLANDTVVTTIMSNLGLYKAFDRAGIRYEKTAVGDKYVSENMRTYGHSLGGEQSGHIIFSKYAVTGDGILTSLMIMETLMNEKAKLSDLADQVQIFPQLLKNVRVADKNAAMNSDSLKAEIAKVEAEMAGDGRVLIRPSGTEPLIRVMVEAKSDELCAEYVERLSKFVPGALD